MGMNTDAVQRLYVAYFNRPADPVSMSVYESLLPTDRAATQAELQALAEQYFSPSAEYTSLYAGMSNTQIVNQLYQNIFGREAEVDGLVYWAAELTAGRQTVASIALQLSYSAQGTDADVVSNRIEAANSFTTGLNTSSEITGYSGDAAAASARAWLATVGSDDASKDAAIAGVDTAISDAVSAGTTDADVTFTLTTGIDDFTGGSGADTFNADNTGTDVTSTADQLDGGAGTDTINLFSDGAAGALPTMTAIEVMNVYDQDATFDVSAATSLTTLNIIRGDGGIFTGGANLATIGLTDITVAATDTTTDDMILNFNAAITAGTLNLTNVNGTAGDLLEDIEVNGSGLTTITVNANSASSFDALDVDAATTINLNAAAAYTSTIATTGTATLNISGAGAVTLGTLDADINTVTSTGSGALTAAIGANVDTVLTGGSGNDVISASTTDTINTTDALAVDAGEGSADVLVIGDTADVNTAADGARYSNFEIIRTAVDQNVSLVSGITAVQVPTNTGITLSGLNSTNANAITVTGAVTNDLTLTLASATGTSDSVTINLESATATTNVDVAGVSVIGVETVNFNAVTGTNTTGDTAITFGANAADSVSAINFTGGADTTLTVAANTLDVVAVTIDASGMTGTADFTLVQTSSLVAGSTVTGTANGDTIALGTTNGNTYNGGGGDDGFTTVVATLAATGSNDTVVNGGDGTDTLTISDDGSTMTDNHFTFVSGMEKLTYSDGGAISLTTGAGFTSAFADGATITAAGMDNDANITVAMGLYDKATTIAITTATDGDTAGNDITITTGDGADSVTLTASNFVVDSGADGGAISISTAAGDDTIVLTVGDLNDAATSAPITINGGAGQDTITVTKPANDTGLGYASFVITAGHSTTTAYDTITGFDVSDGTEFSDELAFTGTAAISDFTNTVDFGIIKSHSLTAGVATFDDAAAFSTALVINSSNLSDVLGYLAANTDALDTVAFAYDSDGDGTADATMVYNNGTVTDSLVLLAGVTGVDALITTNAAGANDLFIS
jgi:hypothetical protein